MVIRGRLVARVKRLRNSTAVMNRLFCNVYDFIANSFLWLIDSACKSGRWLCCDSRGREGRGRERSR